VKRGLDLSTRPSIWHDTRQEGDDNGAISVEDRDLEKRYSTVYCSLERLEGFVGQRHR
jgi:hypothetical protein